MNSKLSVYSKYGYNIIFLSTCSSIIILGHFNMHIEDPFSEPTNLKVSMPVSLIPAIFLAPPTRLMTKSVTTSKNLSFRPSIF